MAFKNIWSCLQLNCYEVELIWQFLQLLNPRVDELLVYLA